jgi:hypothetical protein
MKKLERSEMKKLKGGLTAPPPGGGGDPGGGSGGGYMCFWIGTNNCSVCVPGAYPICIKGAEARAC